MIALIQRSLTLGLLLIGVALALWAGLGDRQGPPIALLLLLCFGHAGILALEMVMMHAVNARDPAPRATVWQVVRAWVAESLHAPLVFCWRQPFRSHRVADFVPGRPAFRLSTADAETDATDADAAPAARAAAGPPRRGVLLIHGFVCNRGIWNRWLLRLRAQGVPFVAVNLEPVFGGIDDYVESIERAVVQLQETTGQPPVAVAHSMGGLALRRWWSVAGNAHRIAHALTVGSPHRGTWLARFAMSPNARQMQPGSAWLRDLQRREQPETLARMTCFYSNVDNIVFPTSAATLQGADNRLLPGVPHVAMVDDLRPWAELQRRLAAG
jgi:pimeloyl-ACP methyl ester carboxylesterase